jgi:diaminohydroxyphosphoribosylaminopyrimidine deaminase/5-amino-6-(5-phosphoribosylamino)uracil reductase
MMRPTLVLKAGITLDGRIGDAFGHSQWITGPAARRAGHRLRAEVDGILVGSGTLLADDPSLSTRMVEGTDARPILLDSRLRCPPTARVLTAGLRPWVFCAHDAPERTLPADLIRVGRGPRGLDLLEVMQHLHDRGLRRVLVEGGGCVHRAMFEAGLVDELHLFIAPKVLAGGPGWLAGPGYPLASAPQLEPVSVSMVGPDVHLVLRRAGVTESVPGGPPQK